MLCNGIIRGGRKQPEKDKLVFEDYEQDPNNTNYIFVLSSPGKMFTYFKKQNFNPDKDSVLDIGSGLGKMLCLVFSHFFKVSIGVEIDKNRYKISKNNIKLLKLEKLVKVKNIDVLDYAIPTYINVFYMYNPFYDSEDDLEPLQKVLTNIKKSYNKKPRKLHVFFYNPESNQTIKLIEKVLNMKILQVDEIERGIKMFHLVNNNNI